MTEFNRHNVTGFLNQSPGDKALKVEVHPNAHTSLLNVYSEDRTTNSTYARADYEIGAEILQSKVNKLALSSYDLRYCISNINPRNDTIIFFSSFSALQHTVIIPNEHYTVNGLIMAIVTALNSVTGASGLTFSFDPLGACTYDLKSAGGDFQFISSSHIDRAGPCSGLFITSAPVSSQIVFIGAQYANYLDVIIENFRDAQILKNSFTKDNTFPINGHMFRITINQTDEYVSITEEVKNLNFVSIRNKELTTLQILLYDQFGDLVFSPCQTLGGEVFNIPLIKYEMKFDISA